MKPTWIKVFELVQQQDSWPSPRMDVEHKQHKPKNSWSFQQLSHKLWSSPNFSSLDSSTSSWSQIQFAPRIDHFLFHQFPPFFFIFPTIYWIEIYHNCFAIWVLFMSFDLANNNLCDWSRIHLLILDLRRNKFQWSIPKTWIKWS
jgi:hypothetical protein